MDNKKPYHDDDYFKGEDNTTVIPVVRDLNTGGTSETLPEVSSEPKRFIPWFDLKRFTIEVVLAATVCAIVTAFLTAVADKTLASLLDSYVDRGTGFYLISALIIAGLTVVSATTYMLLILGTKSYDTLYKLMFWVAIPSTFVLTLLSTKSLTAVPVLVVILIWSVPVCMIPSRVDQNRLDFPADTYSYI